MRAVVAAATLALFAPLVTPAAAWAKGRTARVTLTCEGLSGPVEITDTTVLAFRYGPWSGGFLDSTRGPVARPREGLRVCEVAFYVAFGDRTTRLAYVLYYCYDRVAAARQGFVYLPGEGSPWYALNVATIDRFTRGGRWQMAARPWEDVIRQAIARADRLQQGS